MHRFFVTLGILMLSASCARAQKTELVVSAAASLQDVLGRIAASYEKTHPQVTVRFNFGSSGALRAQIEQGAPVDLFIAADDENMNVLAAKNLVDKSSRGVLAENRLVLIVPKNSALPIHRFKDVALPLVKHVAIGAPGVPAGKRAQEVFTHLGVWAAVNAKAVRGKDVRAALAQVALGNVAAGVVYQTDALSSPQVRVTALAPLSMHRPVRYPFAVVAASKKAVAARAFARDLSGVTSKTILKSYGFIVR